VFSRLFDSVPTIDGKQSASHFEGGGRRDVSVKSTMQIVGTNIGNRLDLNVFWINRAHEDLSLIAASDDSDANGIAVSEPIASVETGDGNGRDGGSENAAFEETASGLIARCWRCLWRRFCEVGHWLYRSKINVPENDADGILHQSASLGKGSFSRTNDCGSRTEKTFANSCCACYNE
jgi:hypothetical protein